MGRNVSLAALAIAVVCISAVSSARTASTPSEEGRYLVSLLGCGGCHTPGLLLGRQTGPWLSGSDIGVAHLEVANPAVVFPGNLTPDPTTGLGAWTRSDMEALLRRGLMRDGRQAHHVMPWTNYSRLSDADVDAITAYLKSLDPVVRRVPENVKAGEQTAHPYVRYSFHLFFPSDEPCLQDAC